MLMLLLLAAAVEGGAAAAVVVVVIRTWALAVAVAGSARVKLALPRRLRRVSQWQS